MNPQDGWEHGWLRDHCLTRAIAIAAVAATSDATSRLNISFTRESTFEWIGEGWNVCILELGNAKGEEGKEINGECSEARVGKIVTCMMKWRSFSDPKKTCS